MAWTTMHFAVGMGCAGALAGAACVVTRRGWRFIPAAMTAGQTRGRLTCRKILKRLAPQIDPASSMAGSI